MTQEVGIQYVGQIAIAVSDIQTATDFYHNKLGLTLLFETPSGLAFFDCGGTRLMLTTKKGDDQDHKTSVIYYKVKEINSAAKALNRKGVTFIQEPQLAAKMPDHELWIGFLRDPDGNLIGIMDEKPLKE
jgi:catechol 2,3-dioxygenase-like lactoylglutathione lyase family enzyme